ncbi:Putative fungal domain of STAND protein [Colletotrichum destructivum]|uniref:Fungal domain of STAND protein n=1 Tax=Colletotrichum destructivum TaxID=34406 RepID=A0AAX4ICS0_9PEZI|nr:Putative fungal domain of STAND protein [Colletotrichum destructivum]
MEVLSGVSSGFAVVSLALQLAEKVTKIHDFWRSVRDAPDELGSIAAELEFLERVYIGIAHNAQRETIDPILTKALEDGQQEVTRFEALVSPLRKRCETESKLKRKWASIVAGVWRKEEVAEFRNSISRTKSTLLMALQASARHRSVSDSANQTRMLATLAENSASLGTGQKDIKVAIGDLSQKTGSLSLELTSHFSSVSSQSSDIKEIKEQLAGMQSFLIAHMAHSFPGIVRVQLAESMKNEVREFERDAFSSDNASSTDSPASSGASKSDSNTLEASTQNEVGRREKTSSITYRALSRHHYRKTVFGTFVIRLRMSAMYQSADPQADRTSYTISFYPAHWLVWCGVRYGMQLSLLQSMGGWTRRLEPLRMVRDDALVFKLCREGNIGAIRTLIAKGEASARDITPNWNMPLHEAAYHGHFELCVYLISEGADTFGVPFNSPLISHLFGTNELHRCIDLKFFELFEGHLEAIPEMKLDTSTFTYLLFCYPLENITASETSDRHCDLLCELFRQYPVPIQQIIQHANDASRRGILEFSARCSFGAFRDILSLDEAFLEPVTDRLSFLELLAETDWDESEMTARLQFLQNRGVDLLPVSKKYSGPLFKAARNPDWLRTWVASLRNCGKSVHEIVTVQLSASTPLLYQGGWESETLHHLLDVCRGLPVIGAQFRLCKMCRCDLAEGFLGFLSYQPWWIVIGAGLLRQKCICRLLSLVGSSYRNLCPRQEHECDFGSNNILRDAVDVEYLSMEGGAEADDEEQDTIDEEWETEYEDGQSEDQCKWKPGEWICWKCDRRLQDSESKVAEDTELKIPGSFVH